ncbi:hypothetical protein SVAN01_01829 [Stagonosporopsis vannaccii]|nr:hypothetical protein SVAN01_01829 [Stagonosporopsis vannaccii]
MQPGKETFVCAAVTNTDVTWVAQVTLRGPLSAREFDLPFESLQPAVKPDEEEAKWQMLSLYTLPSHRSKGLGQNLCREAFRFLRSLYSKQSILRGILVRIMVKPDNTVTIRMYEKLGFVRTGVCTLEEALIANGDAGLLPQGVLPVSYKTRTGIIMALAL